MVLEPHFLFLPRVWSSSRRRYLRQGVCHPGGSSVDDGRTCCPGSFYPIHTGERVMLPTLMRRVYFFYSGSRAVLQWCDAPRVTRRPAELLLATNQDSTLSDSPPLLFLFKDSSSYSRLPPPSSSPGEGDSYSPILPMLHKLKLILLKASPLNFLPSAIPLHLVTPTFSYFHFSKWEPGISH